MLIDISQIEVFLLVFIRISSALVVLPVFENKAFPTSVKVGFSIALTLLLMPVLQLSLPHTSGTLVEYFLLAMREVACGILMGFAGQFLFYAVEIAGQLIGFQSGLSIVSSIDPNTNANSDVLTKAYRLLMLMLFLSFNGHHLMLQTLVDSFHIVPIGQFSIDGRITEWAYHTGTLVMAKGVQLAAPLMISLLLTDIGLGILTRVAPTMNVFILGFPLKIGLTMFLASVSIGVVTNIFSVQYVEFMRSFPSILRLMVHP
ncbi:flagellar biosynthetic protein FliR [bacterium]|nr:MAG: flagellar biosynthetic protein FliR [bacterium]